MGFVSCFEKRSGPVDSAVALDRSDITLAEPGGAPNSSKASRGLSRGNTARDRQSGQNKSGLLTNVFGSEKEIDPDRFPHKSWTNSRIPG